MKRRTRAALPCWRPLWSPASAHVEHCYAMHGKGWSKSPVLHAQVELVLIIQERRVRCVPGSCPDSHRFFTDAVPTGSGWRILGWKMADGSKPHGDYDAVDPEMALIERLPAPNLRKFDHTRSAAEPRPIH